jgi:hypothetical protein
VIYGLISQIWFLNFLVVGMGVFFVEGEEDEHS